ncbi:hypothetical protein [Roseivirga misakiensis]|uniref:UspA domain-containing protein n=1 Tax=Roseivirga misakiensis TaxID=1563681 RepID=A0A1E5SL16_9BACT|nr:hypothetical protein [Roseivirga misakiensis]OEJ99783.1 hypothetical protein BFP71_09480 [Roseivirga misakiensis]
MKHKILLAANTASGLEHLFEDLTNLLNKTHKKYVTAFPIKNYDSGQLVASSNDTSDQNNLDNLVEGLENAAMAEQQAADFNLELDWIGEKVDDKQLASLSTVYDLLIWEQSVHEAYDNSLLKEIIDTIKCPMLFLPNGWRIENLVVFHDGSMDSVKMVKGFINVFNPSLRDLPLSVLINHSDDSYNVLEEKVFIDYLKLFFKNIGVQLVEGDLLKQTRDSSPLKMNNPFLMLGVNRSGFEPESVLSSPTFLFKG